MPPELRDPGDPAEWLGRARSNLAKARTGDVPGVVYEDLCFDAQQASEKAIKALLVRQQVVFPIIMTVTRRGWRGARVARRDIYEKRPEAVKSSGRRSVIGFAAMRSRISNKNGSRLFRRNPTTWPGPRR